MQTGEAVLDAAALARWDGDGFVVVERLVGPEVVEELRAAYDAIIERSVVASGDTMLGGITRQVMLPSTAHPTFADNAALRAAKALAARLFDADEIVMTFDMLIDKPAGHPHETPWHQDQSYVRQPVAPAGTPIQDGVVQVWIALDDADEANGCMQFVPGRHREPMLEHHVASGDPADSARLLALVDAEGDLDLSTAVVGAVPAGGCTLHGMGTPHYTGPNTTADRPRRAYIVNLSPLGRHLRPA